MCERSCYYLGYKIILIEIPRPWGRYIHIHKFTFKLQLHTPASSLCLTLLKAVSRFHVLSNCSPPSANWKLSLKIDLFCFFFFFNGVCKQKWIRILLKPEQLTCLFAQGVLPYFSHRSMCHWTGHGFKSLSVWNRV